MGPRYHAAIQAGGANGGCLASYACRVAVALALCWASACVFEGWTTGPIPSNQDDDTIIKRAPKKVLAQL